MALSLELPSVCNKANISCIPVGDYLAQWMSGRNRFEVKNVPTRSLIRIHVGNVVNPDNPMHDDSDGCILPGDAFVPGKGGVVDSAKAVARLHKLLGGDEFILRVREA